MASSRPELERPALTGSEAVVERVLGFGVEIKAMAAKHGLPPEVLAGLVCQESQGDHLAVRYEPRYRWLYMAGADLRPGICSYVTELSLQKHSLGLCQVMGAVARERGLKGWLTRLLEPEVGLDLGAAHLRWCLAREEGDMRRALTRYNSGVGQAPLVKEPYCDKVLAWASRFEKWSKA